MAINKDPGEILELKKHVNTIHCSNNLSLIQRKLFNALLFNAYHNLPTQSQFEISAKNLCAIIGYNSHDYLKLKKALLGLMKIVIEWDVINDTSSSPNWRASSILSAAKLEGGICTYEYSTLMRELLYCPEVYGRLDMSIIARFKSNYALALYENTMRYENLPQTPFFPIEVFRKLMGVFDDKYPRFNDFNKRVLSIAVNEVKSLSHMNIEPEIKRKNQNVIAIRFKINAKKKEPFIPNFENKEETLQLHKILSDEFNLSNDLIADLISERGAAYIFEKINYVKSMRTFQNKEIDAIGGYLITAIKNDYKCNKNPKVTTIKPPTIEKAKETKKDNAKLDFIKYVNLTIDNYLFTLSEGQMNDLITNFSDGLKNSDKLLEKWFNQRGLDHPAVRHSFNKFIYEKPNLSLPSMLTFEEFKKVHVEENSIT